MLSSWSSNAEGTGGAPSSFTADGQTFDVQTDAVLNNALTIGGTRSIFRIRAGGELQLNSMLTAPVNMESGAVLHVNTPHALLLGTLHPGSTVHFNAEATTVPAATYGNVFLNGDGSTKTLAGGTTSIVGNLTLSAGVGLEGAPAAASIISSSGDVSLNVSASFEPTQPFSLHFRRGGSQKFTVTGGRAVWHEILVGANTTVELAGMTRQGVFQVGTSSGGSLTVEAGGKFLVRRIQLLISGKAAINPQNETGQVGFRQSSLAFASSSDADSHLYTVAGSDSVATLTTDLTGPGDLLIENTLFVTEHVSPNNGVIRSSETLTLVSTRTKTAQVLPTTGDGAVQGDVVFQRFVPRGKQTRYISLPVGGVSVSEMQQSVPVNGDFNGGQPSLFYYHDLAGGWIPFPESATTETFFIGRGYALDFPDGARDTRLSVSGPIHQGPFTFTPTSNPGNDPSKGWNLIGNPYTSPVEWGTAAWTKADIGAAAYVLDERVPGGRFMVWDGEVGDPEFKGIITQAQGFFIRTTGASPQLTVTEAARADTSSALWRKKDTELHRALLTIALKQKDLIDRTFIKFSDGGDDSFDATDAVKRKNGYFSVSSLSSDSVSLAINHVSESFCDRSIPIAVEASPGNYTLSFDGSRLADAGTVNLHDHFTDEIVTLTHGGQYSFQITADPASQGKRRFEIQMPSGSMPDPVITVEENLLTSNSSSGNQWFLNGEEVEGATGATLVPETSGEYSLQVTLDGCSRVSEPVEVTVTVTGIREGTAEGIRFYPNPASAWIRVQAESLPAGTVSYSIMNTAGVQVASGSCDAQHLIKGYEFDLRALAGGVYFVQLRTGDSTIRGRFIVRAARP